VVSLQGIPSTGIQEVSFNKSKYLSQNNLSCTFTFINKKSNKSSKLSKLEKFMSYNEVILNNQFGISSGLTF
jgi:hypothetical protein